MGFVLRGVWYEQKMPSTGLKRNAPDLSRRFYLKSNSAKCEPTIVTGDRKFIFIQISHHYNPTSVILVNRKYVLSEIYDWG